VGAIVVARGRTDASTLCIVVVSAVGAVLASIDGVVEVGVIGADRAGCTIEDWLVGGTGSASLDDGIVDLIFRTILTFFSCCIEVAGQEASNTSILG
jgi:hypothetical protein